MIYVIVGVILACGIFFIPQKKIAHAKSIREFVSSSYSPRHHDGGNGHLFFGKIFNEKNLDQKLWAAGLKITAVEFSRRRSLFTSIFILTGVALSVLFGSFLVFVVFAILAAYTPTYYLNSLAKDRLNKISRAFPDFVNQLQSRILANMPITMALKDSVSSVDPILSDEVMKLALDIEIDETKSLRDFSQRVNIPMVQYFVSTIEHGQAQGYSIAKIISSIARDMKIRQYEKRREEIKKAPQALTWQLFPIILSALLLILFPLVFSALQTIGSIHF